MNTINIWNLGGAAVKISTRLKFSDTTGVLPTIESIFVDTSNSEEVLLGDGETLHVLDTDDMGGSGQVKGAKVPEMQAQLPQIMNNVPDSNINFLLCNISGGSGSTMAHIVASTLLKENRSVVLFASSTPDTLVRKKNTNKTLSGFDNLAKANKCIIPIVLADTRDEGYIEADQILATSINVSAAMLHTGVVGLDDSDRKNFLNPLNMPDNSCGLEPGLVEMNIQVGEPAEPTMGVSAILTLVPAGQSDQIGTDALTIFSGILDDNIKEVFLAGEESKDALSLLLKPGSVYEYSKGIEGEIKEIEKSSSVNKIVGKITTTGTSGDDGLVL